MSYTPKENIDLSGDPTAPTASSGDSDTSIATTSFVQAAIGTVTPSVVHDSTITQVSMSGGSRAASLVKRYDHAVCTDETTGKIYSIGGISSATNVLASVEEYDPTTNAWTTKTSMPQTMHGGRAVWIDPSIYVLDGFRTLNTLGATSYKYTPSADTWASVTSPSANRMRSRGGVVASGSSIYLIAGLMGASGVTGAQTNTVDKYDSSLDSWTNSALTSIPQARSNIRAVVSASGKIYIGAGRNTVATASDVFNTYNLNSGSASTWDGLTGVPYPVDLNAMSIVGGSIYFIGGRLGYYQSGFTVTACKFVQIYDIESGTWQVISQFDIPAERAYIDSVVSRTASGDAIFVHGGADRFTTATDGTLNTMHAFCLSLNLFTASRSMNIQAMKAVTVGSNLDHGTLLNRSSDCIQIGGISAASGDVIHAPTMAWSNVSAKYKLMG